MKRIFNILLILALASSFAMAITLGANFFMKTDDGIENTTELNNVNYAVTNDFAYEISDTLNHIVYAPKDVNYTYGLLFYVGTAIAPEHYDYLASALAKQGYLVVINKNPLAWVLYDEEEPTFENYPNVKFFVGGHSQGGGATVKRTKENIDKVQGMVLLAPLAYTVDSVADKNIPTLLINAKNDGVLTEAMKETSKQAIPENRTEYTIDGAHMSFSSFDNDGTLKLFNDGPATAEVKAEQKRLTIEYTLQFMLDTIAKTPMPL